MPPGSSVVIGRQNIRDGRTLSNLCIFCQLANIPSRLRSTNGLKNRRSMSTLPGSRGLHAGTPAHRPPSESSPLTRPSWTAAQPSFDNSTLNSFLKARKAKESSSEKPVSNLFKPPPEEMGKWAKSSQLFRPRVDAEESEARPHRKVTKDSHQNSFQLKPLLNKSLSTDHLKQETVAAPGAQEPRPANPYADIIKSKRSSMDIESDLFAGIDADSSVEIPKRQKPSDQSNVSQKPSFQSKVSQKSPSQSHLSPKIPSNSNTSQKPEFSNISLDNLFAKLDINQNKPNIPDALRGSYTKSSQPFKVSDSSLRTIMKALQEENPTAPPSHSERPIKQFGFMSTRQQKSATERPTVQPQAPLQHPDIVHEAPEGMKHIDSTQWQSSSREKWTYEVDPQVEAEREAERLLAADAKAHMTKEEKDAEMEEQMEKMLALDKLVDRAKAAKFRVGLRDLAIWKGDVQRVEAPEEITVPKNLYIPPSISVTNFAGLLKVPLATLQKKMELLGLEPEQCQFDYVLDDEMASLIAPEFGFEPHVDAVAAFDLFPQPMPANLSSVPLRPPIVTIMGHVDHGKTTLLDTLRKTSVAANEAGGITQHIGAFSVTLSSGEKITFLDTPGHAAFLTMRERGANVTDIIVLVVAADDGVMPQTREAIAHAKAASVPVIVAINKCDLEDADPKLVKTKLLEAELELEEFGGDVQCVEVSGLTGKGLDDLETAIVTLAEVLEMRAPTDGMMEGCIIESTVDPGRGTYTTVLVKRGILKTGDFIVAGVTYAKVRRMTTADGKSVKQALPGTPVEVTGWKDRPDAGDLVLQAPKELDAKLAVRNRIQLREQDRDQKDIESLNERRLANRKGLWQERERKLVAAEIKRSGQALPGILREQEHTGPKELRVIIKTDVSGSAEAVEEAIKDLGNAEVKVGIVDVSVGEVTESDVQTAIAANAKIIGFNIRALNPNLRSMTNANNVEIFYHSIIYKLIDDVVARLESMLAPMVELTVTGEAEIVQLFDIKLKGKQTKAIAGCKVFNGVISSKQKCRITRNGKIIFTGYLDTLKRFKDDVQEVRKGNDCGLSFAEFEELKVGDLIQSYKEIESKRKLYQ